MTSNQFKDKVLQLQDIDINNFFAELNNILSDYTKKPYSMTTEKNIKRDYKENIYIDVLNIKINPKKSIILLIKQKLIYDREKEKIIKNTFSVLSVDMQE